MNNDLTTYQSKLVTVIHIILISYAIYIVAQSITDVIYKVIEINEIDSTTEPLKKCPPAPVSFV